MKASPQEQKQNRLKQFLERLSADPSLCKREGLEQPKALSDFLIFAGYSTNSSSVDLAKVVSSILQKLGMDACSEQLMEHFLQGGTLKDFMK